MMDAVSRVLTGLLRRSVRLLPLARRQWGEAVWAEAGDVPVARRFGWVVGGLWLVLRQALNARRLGYWLGVGAVAVLAGWVVWHSWSGPSDNPATYGNRLRVTGLVVALAGLPWIGRRRGLFGPVGDAGSARVVRVAGFAAICALTLASTRLARFASARFATGTPVRLSLTQQVQLGLLAAAVVALFVVVRWPRLKVASWAIAVAGAMLLLALLPVVAMIAVYTAAVLALTSRSASFPARLLAGTVGAGVVGGVLVWALMPAGHPLSIGESWLAVGAYAVLVPVTAVGLPGAAGFVAARCTDGSGGPAELARARARWAVQAGAIVAAAGALILTILTVYTMAIHPDLVRLEPDGPHGPPHTAYEVEMSVGDAAQNYLLLLLGAPLIGAALGAVGCIGLNVSDDQRDARAALTAVAEAP